MRILLLKKTEFLRNELSALSEPLHILFLDGSTQSVLVHILNLCHLQRLRPLILQHLQH